MTPNSFGTRRGFTLLELVIVVVILGVIGATVAVFMRPAFEAWLGARSRAGLVAEADHGLRRMQQEVQTAVPNSIRSPGDQCFELVPTIAGGRYRVQADTVNSGTQPAADGQATSSFDVLSSLARAPAVGDWVVVNNQNPNDVYSGANRSAVTAVTTPAATAGLSRIAINAMQFPLGYVDGRFVVVPDADQAVFFVCSGADGTLDGNGNGKGQLLRLSHYGFNAALPTACPSTTGAALLVANVRSCRFLYSPNQGATQQSGYLSMQVELARRGESASLLIGAHVLNAP